MKMRTCAVAGMFYPRDPNHLEQLLTRFFTGASAAGQMDARGVVAPHAGYIYSGAVAAQAFSAVPASFSGTFVIIGPSHRGFLTSGSAIPWETPLGVVDTDADFIADLGIPVDEPSHTSEHSIEVQVPFIKFRFPRARIAPVMMGDQDHASAVQLGQAIAETAKAGRREIKIVASSDFSHYIPEPVAREQDLYAIEALRTLDTAEFYRRILERKVSACGYGPITAMAEACRALGGREGRLLTYATSGDVTGDLGEVVGYAAVAVI